MLIRGFLPPPIRNELKQNFQVRMAAFPQDVHAFTVRYLFHQACRSGCLASVLRLRETYLTYVCDNDWEDLMRDCAPYYDIFMYFYENFYLAGDIHHLIAYAIRANNYDLFITLNALKPIQAKTVFYLCLYTPNRIRFLDWAIQNGYGLVSDGLTLDHVIVASMIHKKRLVLLRWLCARAPNHIDFQLFSRIFDSAFAWPNEEEYVEVVELLLSRRTPLPRESSFFEAICRRFPSRVENFKKWFSK
jgi:hypothetical protein